MKTELRVSEIKTAKYNPKQRTEQIKQLVDSIREYGIIMPLIIDGEQNLTEHEEDYWDKPTKP